LSDDFPSAITRTLGELGVDILDPALLRPGRFDIQVAIPLPDQEGRRQIFEIGLRDKPIAGVVDLAGLAASTGGFSGAEIRAVCTRAAWAAIREAVAELTGSAASAEVSPRVTVTAGHLILQR